MEKQEETSGLEKDQGLVNQERENSAKAGSDEELDWDGESQEGEGVQAVGESAGTELPEIGNEPNAVGLETGSDLSDKAQEKGGGMEQEESSGEKAAAAKRPAEAVKKAPGKKSQKKADGSKGKGEEEKEEDPGDEGGEGNASVPAVSKYGTRGAWKVKGSKQV